ncbi:MAG: type VI secretion system tip protein VgrG [Pseudaminobacter sp.]|nr:type VI secretion system tip protein VgrG [Pseudaminobacter sp.]
MAVSFGQTSRLAQFDTPLGKDKLVLVGFECTEGLSKIFEFRVDVIASDPVVDFDAILGRNCTLTFNTHEHGRRYFDGILTEAQQVENLDDKNQYRLILRPWLWLLSFRTNCLIFHDKTAPEIIEEIFGKHGFALFSSKLSKSYPKLEYCVQYRESDMAFVCRLMEKHGINYYFEHMDGEHKLILADGPTGYKTIPGNTRRYAPNIRQRWGEKEHFYLWRPERRFTAGKVTLKDYDFKRPWADLTSEETGDAAFENGSLEIYDFPGKYTEQGDGLKYARAQMDRERAADGHFFAEGACAGCFAGGLFKLTDYPEHSQNEEYLILGCVHIYGDNAYRSSSSGDTEEAYEGSYEFVRCDKPYAPPALTKVPRIYGSQTALVVGDGEIDVDEYGRIKVRFYWDRKEDHSMPCRLAHGWSGKQWGGIYIPRVGMEVVVQFLDGYPDYPLVTGAVYNGDNKPPYSLPENKYIAGWKSHSTPGGGGYGGGGSGYGYGGDGGGGYGGGGDVSYPKSDSGGSDGADYEHQYRGSDGGGDSGGYGGGGGGGGRGYNEFVFDDTEGYELIRMHAQCNLRSVIGYNEWRNIGYDRFTWVYNNESLKVDKDRNTKIGQHDKLDVENTLKITVGDEIVLTCGGSKITMTPTSITLEALTIEVKASSYKTSAVMSEHSAAAVMDIKGTLVKINS